MNIPFNPFAGLPNYREHGDGQCSASCPGPSHANGDKRPSFSARRIWTDEGWKWLIYCHAGCTALEIVTAIGLELSDLYDESRAYRPDPLVDLHHQANAALLVWRDSELTKLAIELRTRDGLIRTIDTAVADGDMTVDMAMKSLGPLYENYSELEYRFEILRTGTNNEVLELWRTSRGDSDAA